MPTLSTFSFREFSLVPVSGNAVSLRRAVRVFLGARRRARALSGRLIPGPVGPASHSGRGGPRVAGLPRVRLAWSRPEEFAVWGPSLVVSLSCGWFVASVSLRFAPAPRLARWCDRADLMAWRLGLVRDDGF